AVKNVAKANGQAKLKDFATTLMFAICKRYDFGWFIASFWVGDGAMCIFDEKNKMVKLLGTPDEGEYSGQTRFLTMPEIFRDPEAVSKRLRMAIVPDFTALFLMTDGVSDPMFETEKNLNDYHKWEEFYEKLTTGFPEDEIGGVALSDDNEESKEQLLRWLDFWSPGNHDDRTIAILY
ncbi:MAG: protein phosphatase 2C domain-containing protein, partial [Muribaculaceae bacterium]|nr:protein phosphatase 2C domain-containing protein [Muribaculaceae bacterium]